MLSMFRASIIVATLSACAPALAQPASGPASTGAWSLQYGMDGSLHRATVNYETAPVWSYPIGGTRIDLVGEFGVSYWHVRNYDGPGRDKLWQFSAIPMFQWWLTPRLFVEAGVGATAFNHTTLGDDNLSTAFQFGDHLGVGYQLTDQMRLGVRLSHFSNAGIKHPNPGLNSWQAGLTMRF
ncbi:acyloxyacyl hydrolase [Verticiella sediminum]|uniref:Lipid A deacylase n=1 Tax=Verticiella sediminum TaxID=1247510 RepID=A0A556A6K0_9BURK|nr:acyloxyacyl hydrolase [Verticiella sediminum]TSH88494.1 acyloxyacyl hydrolase [Verticiella sediminum]